MKKTIISGLAGVVLMSLSACSSMNQESAAQPDSTSNYARVQSQVPFPDISGFYNSPYNPVMPPPAGYEQ